MLKTFYQIIRALLLSLTLLVPSALYANTQIIVLGDSLSSGYKMDPKLGWVNLIRENLVNCHPDFEVINLSASGDTTRNGLTKVKLALEQKPGILILELGGNDGLRGYPLLSIKKNLKKIIETTQGSETKVLLVGIKLPPNYGGPYSEQFYNIYKDLSEQYSLPFVDFILDGIATNKELMLSDGIHPNAKAQPIIAQNVWPILKPMLPEETTQNCSF